MRPLAFALGALLLIGAVATVMNRGQTLTEAFDAIADLSEAQRWRLIFILCATVACNIVLTGCMFSVLMSRYGRVGWFEMQSLIASATLLNYLPLRPGVFGRVAYHKTVNHIAMRDSATAIVQAVLLSAGAAGCLTVLVLIARGNAMWLSLGIAMLLALLAMTAIASRGQLRALCLAGAVRVVDVLVTAARYYAAFALIGAPIDLTGAISFACISVIATMVPLVSNGLGLREWAVGMLAPAIASHHVDLGITADLVNRAAELLMVALAGVPATIWLSRHARRGLKAP